MAGGVPAVRAPSRHARRRWPLAYTGQPRSSSPDPPGPRRQRAAFSAALEERLGVMVPSEDPNAEPEGEAWPTWQPAHRDAILQPPKPEMRPSPQLERARRARDGGGTGL